MLRQLTDQEHGGHNKEQILLTVDTFKALCMTANTEKGKNTRRYYIKLESLIFEYFEKKNLNLIKQIKSENKTNLALQKEKTLLKSHKNDQCVYILRVSEIDESDDENFIIKIGETDDISTRIISLRQEYKNCILIGCYPCSRSHQFEQYLLKRPDVMEHRLIPSEMVKISEKLTYTELIKIINDNVENFNGYTPSQKIQLNYSKERKLLMDIILKETNEEQKKNFQGMLSKLYEIQSNEIISNGVIMDEEKIPNSNRRVYKYNKDDLTNPIGTYNSLKEAARSLNNPNLHDYHIKIACENNTLFADFRWFFADNSTEIPEDIPETAEPEKKQTKRFGLVAQINQLKTKIINVYSSQSFSAKTLNIPTCSITHSMTIGIKAHNFYWKMYDDCSSELKQTFEGKLPNKSRILTSSKQVQRLDTSTDEILETYESIQVVCSKYKTRHKTVHKLCKSGDIYRGFKWKIT